MKTYPIADASSLRLSLKDAGKPSAGQQGQRYGSEIPVDFRSGTFRKTKPEPEKAAGAPQPNEKEK